MTNADRLKAYLDAEARILKGQRVAFEGRTLDLADLAEVRKAIKELEARVRAEAEVSKGRESRYAVADFSRGVR